MARRPDACPDCGASCTAHTGSYCHDCGALLLPLRPQVEAAREAWERHQENQPDTQLQIST